MSLLLKLLIAWIIVSFVACSVYVWLRYRADKRERLQVILNRLMELDRLDELHYDTYQERQELMQELEENYPCQQ
mgnify:CR=1 FL=1